MPRRVSMTKDVNSPTRSLFEVDGSNSGGTFRTGFLQATPYRWEEILALLNEEAGNNNKVI